ncbi:hypothetical protein JCM10207_004961 [Rhodosporidiobolus poonsookiae]
MEQHLVSVGGVRLLHLAGGDETLLFEGVASLALHRPPPPRSRSASPLPPDGRRVPPPVPPRPADKLSAGAPPPPAYSPTPSASTSTATSSSPQEWLSLTLTQHGEPEPVFSMPISLEQSAHSVVAVPPAAYILPNLTGVDPASLPFVHNSHDNKGLPRESESGFIKLVLPTGSDGSAPVDPETRELFEAALYGLYRGAAPGNVEQLTDAAPNQLYLVDEASGQVVGELATQGMVLEEDGHVAGGKMADAPGSIPAVGEGRTSLDGHEPVVIDSLVPVDDAAGAPSITYSVKPVSAYYQPAENPGNSSLIGAANFLSRGIIVGSNLLAKQFEGGAGRFVASRPATTSPMVFTPETKARFEKGNAYTAKATVYSGKAARAVGNLASQLGDKIGKSTGIQSQPGGPPPKGWKGAVASTLTAVNTVVDHLEAGGKTLIDSGSKSASQVIHHQYGSEARGVADNVGGSVKHVALVYIDARGVGRKALLKSVGKSALRAKMADGSELYLTNENGQLQQIEASAAQGGNVQLALEGGASGSTTPFGRGGTGTTTPVQGASGSGGLGLGGWGGKEKKA